MTNDQQRVAADFDVRAPNYSRNQWHRVYAEGLIAHSTIRTGDRELDAGVGTRRGHVRFQQALGQRRSSAPSFSTAEVLYAYGTKPGNGHTPEAERPTASAGFGATPGDSERG